MTDTSPSIVSLVRLKFSTTSIPELYEAGVRTGLEDNKAHIADVNTLREVDSGNTQARAFARGYFDGLVQNWGEAGASLQYGPANMRVEFSLQQAEDAGRILRTSTLNTSLFRGGLLAELAALIAPNEEVLQVHSTPIEGRPLHQYHLTGPANGLGQEPVNMFIIAPSLEIALRKFTMRHGLEEIAVAL